MTRAALAGGHAGAGSTVIHPRVEQLDPVPHGPLRSARKVRETTDIGGRDEIRHIRPRARRACWTCNSRESSGCSSEYVPDEPQHEVRIGDGCELQSERKQDLLDPAGELHSVLQRARRDGTRRAAGRDPSCTFGAIFAPLGADNLDRVARDPRHPLRAFARSRESSRSRCPYSFTITPQPLAVTTTASTSRSIVRPPRVDVAACERQSALIAPLR